jgi:hypothetical protein
MHFPAAAKTKSCASQTIGCVSQTKPNKKIASRAQQNILHSFTRRHRSNKNNTPKPKRKLRKPNSKKKCASPTQNTHNVFAARN